MTGMAAPDNRLCFIGISNPALSCSRRANKKLLFKNFINKINLESILRYNKLYNLSFKKVKTFGLKTLGWLFKQLSSREYINIIM